MTNPIIQELIHNPEPLHAELAKRSLYEFIKQFWHIIDPAPFKDNWHIHTLAQHLQNVTNGKTRRLLINIPPRHMKSLAVSVAWPAWTWIQNKAPLAGPAVRFLYSSYAQHLATRDSIKCRRLIESPLFQHRWKPLFSLNKDENTKTRFSNRSGGYRLATSVGGALTGEGGDVIVIDDPHNVVEKESEVVRQSVKDWWDEAMSNRLNDPETGAYVMIMQRVHYQDLAGHVLDKGGWTHLCLPARYESDHPYKSKHDKRRKNGALLWPSRFPERALKQLETDLGSYGAAGQLQQRPSPRSGGMFARASWDVVSAVPDGGRQVRGWDLAASTGTTAAYTAGVRMKMLGGMFYIDDVIRFRGTPAEVVAKIQQTARRDGPRTTIDLPQDPGQAGLAQAHFLVQQLAGYNVRYSPETGAKEVRAEALSAQVEARNVKLLRAPWNTLYIDEASYFPNSDYSDQVDASSRAFHRLVRMTRRAGLATSGARVA